MDVLTLLFRMGRVHASLKNETDGAFIGELSDPLPVIVHGNGALKVDTSAYGVLACKSLVSA